MATDHSPQSLPVVPCCPPHSPPHIPHLLPHTPDPPLLPSPPPLPLAGAGRAGSPLVHCPVARTRPLNNKVTIGETTFRAFC